MKKRLPLRSFRLHNFKAVRDSGRVNFGPLTVFIGNNGSGKSSLIEGLETFRDIVLLGVDDAMRRWRGFEHLWNHAVKHDLRRSADDRPHHSNPMIFRIDLRQQEHSVKAAQELNLGEGGNELFIQQEQYVRRRLGDREQLTRDASGNLVLSADSANRRLRVKPSPLSERLGDGQSSLKEVIGEDLERWQFLTLTPDAMGEPVPQQRAGGCIRLAKNGANIAEYLQEIRDLDLNAFNGILEAVRYVLPYMSDLQPTLASELERAFYLKLKEEHFEVLGWLLSTGTLRIVALLACLRHPDPPPLLVVEEIENGLDPRTLQLLVAEIQEAITVGSTQVILTTHSPYLLDLLHLSHIIVVEREENEPKFWRPSDEKELRTWAKEFSPGQLYTMGHLTGRGRK